MVRWAGMLGQGYADKDPLVRCVAGPLKAQRGLIRCVSGPIQEALPGKSLALSSDEDEYFPVDDEFLLSSLTTLSIENCVNLKTLDGSWLRSLTSLYELLISGCRKLESLPEEGLRSSLTLKKLCIYSCPMLETLPEEGLPRSLEVLRLCWNHPKLRERCRRDIGPDWPKIAHINDHGNDKD
ncbi:Disease resistance protein RGA2-like protein [Drosera capensis]